jgi:Domain of unknown function (DUF222)/HNH endonuclease
MFAPVLSLASSLAELHAAIDRGASEPLAELPDAALAEDLVELRRGVDRLEAEFARRLRPFDKHHGCAAEGAISTVSWLRHRCRISGGAATERVAMARHLAELPQTAAAFGEGEVGFEQVRVITRAAESIGDDLMRGAEQILVEAAQRLDPQRLQIAADRLRHYLAPERMLREAKEDHDRRAFFLSQTLDGVFILDGRLDREGGACLRTAIEALLGPRVADDSRTPAQRRADALVELARQRMEATGARPHVSLIVQSETLAGTGTAAAELDGAGIVPSDTALRITCDAALSIITVGRDGEPLDVGRTTRTAPPSLRRAAILRDRGCRFPSCDRPPEWTDAHHLQHWARGGKTSLDNVVLLCRRHHRLVHEGGWQLAWDPDGQLTAAPP